jgi:hypothetical protein
MNIVYSIVDIIRAALFWALGLILGREPAGGEALRLLVLLLAFAAIAGWLGPRWRRLVYRWRFIRRRFLYGERYAGHYIQAIQRGEAIRYAIVHISYNAREGRFEANGRTYNPSGDAVSSFRSAFVLLPTDKNGEIEYIWEGSRAASGYTCMKAEGSDGDLAEGEGYVNAFGLEPKGFRLQFKELEDAGLRETIGMGLPAHAKDEHGFIKKFHKEFGSRIMQGFAPEAEEVP